MELAVAIRAAVPPDCRLHHVYTRATLRCLKL